MKGMLKDAWTSSSDEEGLITERNQSNFNHFAVPGSCRPE